MALQITGADVPGIILMFTTLWVIWSGIKHQIVEGFVNNEVLLSYPVIYISLCIYVSQMCFMIGKEEEFPLSSGIIGLVFCVIVFLQKRVKSRLITMSDYTRLQSKMVDLGIFLTLMALLFTVSPWLIVTFHVLQDYKDVFKYVLSFFVLLLAFAGLIPDLKEFYNSQSENINTKMSPKLLKTLCALYASYIIFGGYHAEWILLLVGCIGTTLSGLLIILHMRFSSMVKSWSQNIYRGLICPLFYWYNFKNFSIILISISHGLSISLFEVS